VSRLGEKAIFVQQPAQRGVAALHVADQVHVPCVHSRIRPMDFLLIALLTLLNGLFAMSEMALASSRKARLTGDGRDGDKRRRGGAARCWSTRPVPVDGAGGHHLHRHAQRHHRRGRVQRQAGGLAADATAWPSARRHRRHRHRGGR
jgi:hypothetical protein